MVRRQVLPLRSYTANEIDALGRCSGWKLVGLYGALEDDVSIHDEQESYRMVCVLQKQ